MREYAIFSSKNSFISRRCRRMVNVSINGSYPLEVVNLGDSLYSLEVLCSALCVAHGRSEFVLLESDDIVADTV